MVVKHFMVLTRVEVFRQILKDPDETKTSRQGKDKRFRSEKQKQFNSVSSLLDTSQNKTVVMTSDNSAPINTTTTDTPLTCVTSLSQVIFRIEPFNT